MHHKFVDTIPNELEDNVLYISLEYNIAKHLCPCGCGSEVVTSLSPVGWQLHYNGETVSLTPSIGNFLRECKSHYFITKDNVVWANSMSKDAIEVAIQRDQRDLNEYIDTKKKSKHKVEVTIQKDQKKPNEYVNIKKKSLFGRIKNKFLKILNLNY